MEWISRSPQIHSAFSNLGFTSADGYHVNENCNAALATILRSILTEDKYLREYRRTINYGQNTQKDLLPLLINAKGEKTIELLVTILAHLSSPVECLLPVEVTSQSDVGLHTVFEINQLLLATKAAFTRPQAMKVVIDFLKKSVHQPKVSPEQCTNISNSLLLLRNILHIPENVKRLSPGNNGTGHSVKNQIIWNMFSQNIDKVLIRLMTMPEAIDWAAIMVQIMSQMYKEQHADNVYGLISALLESRQAESSEDNESNTSSITVKGSAGSSPMWPDLSDKDGSGKSNDEPNCGNNELGVMSENTPIKQNKAKQPFQPPLLDGVNIQMIDQDATPGVNDDKGMSNGSPIATNNSQREKRLVISETSDGLLGMVIENLESKLSSSSNDDIPSQKPRRIKPRRRVNTKARIGIISQERKRKNVMKRGKRINVQGLARQTPTDDEISDVLTEFTIEFLFEGYNSLVQTLHSQIQNNTISEIDTSHFFWLLTYFLKFVTQLELDIKRISAILSFDVVSYVTAVGVNVCEQFELAVKLDGEDLEPSRRRLYQVVAFIREFVRVIEMYKKSPHIGDHDENALITLQNKMCETGELRSLFVLLFRHYNVKYHTKQYLQELVVTNHELMTFMDGAMRSPHYTGSTNMADHIKQFAKPEIMAQYGLLLEDYEANGELVNDCVFTMMHHVAGELDSLTTLYQPKILNTFASIRTSEFQVCDDWSDLVHYVLNTFIKKPLEWFSTENFGINTEILDDEQSLIDQTAVIASAKEVTQPASEEEKKKICPQQGEPVYRRTVIRNS